MPLMQAPDSFTPREHEQMRYDAEREDKQMAYGMEMRKLDLEVEKMNAKFSSWIKLPLYILRLPLLVILGVAYIVHVIVRVEPSENFWNLLK